MGHYTTRDERIRIETLLHEGRSVAYIARLLGKSRQTIYNEIRRGSYVHTCDYYDEVRYSADKAQKITDYNQTAKGRDLAIGNDHAYAAFLEQKIIQERYSPAAALAAARNEGYSTQISVNTLYSYIDKKIFDQLRNKHLLIKGKKRPKAKKPESRVVHPKLPSIEQRPDFINDRSEFGHWEMDLIIGKAQTTAALLTLTERQSREEIIIKIPNKKADTVQRIFDELEKRMGKRRFAATFHSITTDNGSEFVRYKELTNSIHGGKRFDMYYCHSYAAWEKGSCENHNRMIRRWFPKGTDFTHISQRKIRSVQDWMNNYPRRILNWKTPSQAANAA